MREAVAMTKVLNSLCCRYRSILLRVFHRLLYQLLAVLLKELYGEQLRFFMHLDTELSAGRLTY